MPEGDTIHRSAATLHRALAGREIVAARAHDGRLRAASYVGRRVRAVTAQGKHLFVELDDGRAIHSHMGMAGSWHVYKPGERWRLGEHLARLVIETDAYVGVCFSAPQIDLVDRPDAMAANPKAGHLGPDAMAEVFDEDEAVRRLRARADALIGDALLDQTAIAGVGNVYRAEVCFLCGVDPRAPTSAIDDAELRRLVQTARALLRKNMGTATRTTREGAGSRYWVYGRHGEPCLRCGTSVVVERIGKLQRTVSFCPRCQPAMSSS